MSARPALLILLAAALSGCLSREAREAKRMEGRFVVGDPGAGWQQVAPGGADHAFRSVDLGAVIYADSNCGVRFDDSPLPKLAERLTFGVSTTEALFTEEGQVDGRAAFTRRSRGELDGVPVELGVTVLKKDGCVYDLVLIAPPGAGFEAAWPAFEAVLQGFETRP